MKLKNLLLALAFVGFGLTAQAQSVENNASLEERVAQLETKSKVKSFADKYLNLSGYLQAGVSWADNDKTTFYIRRADHLLPVYAQIFGYGFHTGLTARGGGQTLLGLQDFVGGIPHGT